MNSKRAKIRAKYNEKTAYTVGQENLKKPEINEASKVDVELWQKLHCRQRKGGDLKARGC